MVATIFSLIHTAADEIENGRLDAGTAPGALTATLRNPLQPGDAGYSRFAAAATRLHAMS